MSDETLVIRPGFEITPPSSMNLLDNPFLLHVSLLFLQPAFEPRPPAPEPHTQEPRAKGTPLTRVTPPDGLRGFTGMLETGHPGPEPRLAAREPPVAIADAADIPPGPVTLIPDTATHCSPW
jgi:hypothetical protein